MQLCSLRMSEGQVQGDNISDAGSYVSGTAASDAGSFVEKEGSELLDALDIDNYSDSSDGREEEDSSSSVPRSTSPVPEASKPTLTSPKLSNGVYSNDEHLRARLETELAKEKASSRGDTLFLLLLGREGRVGWSKGSRSTREAQWGDRSVKIGPKMSSQQ